MDHVLEHFHRRLQDKEASVEDARVYEDSTKASALEQLVGLFKKEVVGIEHDHTVVIRQSPSVELVESKLESTVEVSLFPVRIIQIFNSHHFSSIFRFPVNTHTHTHVSIHTQ